MNNKRFYWVVILCLLSVCIASYSLYRIEHPQMDRGFANSKEIARESEDRQASLEQASSPRNNIQPDEIGKLNKQISSIPSLAPVIRENVDSVVNISVKGKVEVSRDNGFFNNPFFKDPFFEKFFKFDFPEMPLQRETQAIGSGVVIDASKGYILTNHHVVKDAEEIFVTLLNKERMKAKLLGSDPETDIALIEIKPENRNNQKLHQIKLGSTSNLEVGDFVIAIGNPFGLGHTVTSGIISALNRDNLGITDRYENFIQTDAPINPGNSGGALINLRGELVGINTAINPSGQGIGFAIPVDIAESVVKQIIEYGEVKRGQLGIHIQDITDEIKDAMELDSKEGALVASVAKGSSAEDAGIKSGDIIKKINNEKVKSAADLRNKVASLRVGDKVEITLQTKNKTKIVTAKISKRSVSSKISESGSESTNEIELLKGAEFKEGKNGVLVTKVERNSPAARCGLREGDIITSANEKDVKTPEELFKAAKAKKKGILMHLKRGDAVMFIVIH